jgi:hypothetical protein
MDVAGRSPATIASVVASWAEALAEAALLSQEAIQATIDVACARHWRDELGLPTASPLLVQAMDSLRQALSRNGTATIYAMSDVLAVADRLRTTGMPANASERTCTMRSQWHRRGAPRRRPPSSASSLDRARTGRLPGLGCGSEQPALVAVRDGCLNALQASASRRWSERTPGWRVVGDNRSVAAPITRSCAGWATASKRRRRHRW